LGGKQVHEEAVLIGGPSGAIERRKLAPELSSPPKQYEPSKRPGANHYRYRQYV